MVQTIKKTPTIKLDKERTIKYNLNSLIGLEEDLGITVDKIGEVPFSMKNIRSFLFYGLIHEDKEITQEQIGELVSLENLPEIQAKIVDAFNQANPKN